MTKEDALYKARVYHDKAVIPKIEEDLRVMVYALIGEQKLKIEHSKEAYDTYPSCKAWEKKYCGNKKYHYSASLPSHALVWYGNSYIELYCKIIASIAGNQVYIPFSVLPKDIPEELDNISEVGDNLISQLSATSKIVSTYEKYLKDEKIKEFEKNKNIDTGNLKQFKEDDTTALD